MTRRWVRILTAWLGAASVGAAALVWWVAEQALPPAPRVRWSDRGGMSWCAGTTCEPPEIAGSTVAVIVVLAVVGVAMVAAAVVAFAVNGSRDPSRLG